MWRKISCLFTKHVLLSDGWLQSREVAAHGASGLRRSSRRPAEGEPEVGPAPPIVPALDEAGVRDTEGRALASDQAADTQTRSAGLPTIPFSCHDSLVRGNARRLTAWPAALRNRGFFEVSIVFEIVNAEHLPLTRVGFRVPFTMAGAAARGFVAGRESIGNKPERGGRGADGGHDGAANSTCGQCGALPQRHDAVAVAVDYRNSPGTPTGKKHAFTASVKRPRRGKGRLLRSGPEAGPISGPLATLGPPSRP